MPDLTTSRMPGLTTSPSRATPAAAPPRPAPEPTRPDRPAFTLPSAPLPASGATRAAVMIGRMLRLTRRNVETLMMSLMLPVMLMLVFVYLFGGAIHTGTKYVTYVVPGVIILCVAFGSAQTAVSVCQDMTGGIIDRFRSMDVGGAAIVAGHVVASTVRNALSTAVVFGVAFAIGFRPEADAVRWLAAAGMLLLVIVTISWFSAAIGLLAPTPDAASGFTFVVTFLPYVSSGFVPVDTMPKWLHGFAENQPTTPIVETLRGLLLDVPVGTGAAWRAVAWCLGILAVSVLLSAVLFRRRTAG